MARSEPVAGRRGRALLAAGLALALSGCTELDDFLASIPIFSSMRESPAFDPYEAPRPAPPGAVPFASPGGEIQPPIAATEAALREFGERVENPVPMTEEVLARGKELYATYCFVCHGELGKGAGPVVGPGKFPFAPDLTIPTTVQRTDGYLYAIIRVGRGLMPGYGDRIPHMERWYVVNYVRWLQRQDGTAAAPGAPAAADTAAAGAGAGAEGGQGARPPEGTE